MNFIKRFMIGFVVLFTTLFGIHYTFQQLTTLSNTPVIAEKSGLNEREVTALVTAAFEAVSAKPPTQATENRTESPDQQEAILTAIRKTGIELYVLEKSERTLWRIYNNNGLQHVLTFLKIQTPSAKKPLKVADSAPRGPVVLIITGTKYKDVTPLMDLDIPLNVALEPTSPFSLKNAVTAANHWHEVILDTRNASEFTIDTIPFVTAVLSKTDIPLPFINVVLDEELTDITIGQEDLPQNNIWVLDISDGSTAAVRDWLTSLPETIQFRRISFSDITSPSVARPNP